ncbi:hypothetical protein RDI58_026850 [Solanum bulbocastanum]|uniref:Uncharacterized protein n=1 Tax=Solanum bulbocastanum TaxID=147425 RepID=A0AAN8SXP3_SOLBU
MPVQQGRPVFVPMMT